MEQGGFRNRSGAGEQGRSQADDESGLTIP
jgi:hypothetical protein